MKRECIVRAQHGGRDLARDRRPYRNRKGVAHQLKIGIGVVDGGVQVRRVPVGQGDDRVRVAGGNGCVGVWGHERVGRQTG